VNTVRRESGVTLLEVVIVISIVGIVALIATPNIIHFRDTYRLKRVVNDYVMTVNLTRSQAIAWNRSMRIYHYPDTSIIGDPINTRCIWSVKTRLDDNTTYETIPVDGTDEVSGQEGFYDISNDTSNRHVPAISMTTNNGVDNGDYFQISTRGTIDSGYSSSFTQHGNCFAVVDFRNENNNDMSRMQVCIGSSGIATLHSNADW